MQELNQNELKKTVGGGLSFWGILGIISGAVFIIGVIDGIARPVKCR